MPDNDGVDDALRSAAQTAAALLARNAQQHAFNREQQANNRQQELRVENARLVAEDAFDGIRSPFLPQGPVMGPFDPATPEPKAGAMSWSDGPVLRSAESDASRRSRESVSQGDAEYGQSDQVDQRARANAQDAEARRASADEVRADLRAGLLGDDVIRQLEDLETQAASFESEADWREHDADREWDSASQREIRGRAYDACGNQQAAEARQLADTAQATPPWRAVSTQTTMRKAARKSLASAHRQRGLGDRGR